MSRSNYTDDCDNLALWRGAVQSAINGKRGQGLLRELADGMDAMQEKVLIANELEQEGAYCALGVVGAKRGMSMSHIDPDDPDQVSNAFNVAPALAQEIVYINDEWGDHDETPAARWTRVRKWVSEQLRPDAAPGTNKESK